jgi:hypothetical protein
MNVLVYCTIVYLVKWVDVNKKVDTPVIPLQAHLSVKVDQSFEIVKDSKVISLHGDLIQIGNPDVHGAGIDFFLLKLDLVLSVPVLSHLHNECFIIQLVLKEDLATVILVAVDCLAVT